MDQRRRTRARTQAQEGPIRSRAPPPRRGGGRAGAQDGHQFTGSCAANQARLLCSHREAQRGRRPPAALCRRGPAAPPPELPPPPPSAPPPRPRGSGPARRRPAGSRRGRGAPTSKEPPPPGTHLPLLPLRSGQPASPPTGKTLRSHAGARGPGPPRTQKPAQPASQACAPAASARALAGPCPSEPGRHPPGTRAAGTRLCLRSPRRVNINQELMRPECSPSSTGDDLATVEGLGRQAQWRRTHGGAGRGGGRT